MVTLFVILVIVASVILSLIVLVQNPKGGGLAGNIAGFSNQFMGVKQTTDVLEKGTWIFAGLIGLLCMVSVLFLNTKGDNEDVLRDIRPTSGQTQGTGTSTTPTTPARP